MGGVRRECNGVGAVARQRRGAAHARPKLEGRDLGKDADRRFPRLHFANGGAKPAQGPRRGTLVEIDCSQRQDRETHP